MPIDVGVIGAGTLGTTVVQSFLDCGDRVVVVVRPGPGKADVAWTKVDASITREEKAGRVDRNGATDMRRRVTVTDDLSVLAPCSIVVEATPEDLIAKQRLLADIETHIADSTPVASTTSTIPAAAIARDAAHPERVVVAHYVWPANRVRLVEFAAPASADPRAVDAVLTLLERQGKTVVRTADTPGFLITRALFAYWNEAVELLCEGWSPSELDERIVAAGWPMGPCRLIDATSLASTVTIFPYALPSLGERCPSFPLLEAIVEAGFEGRAAGRGLYVYGDEPGDHHDALKLLPRTPMLDADPVARLMDAMANEVGWCLAENVVDSWETAAIAIDGAYGFGGGLLAHVRSPELSDRLLRHAETVGVRFEPSPTLAPASR